jgi:hypothetical protein
MNKNHRAGLGAIICCAALSIAGMAQDTVPDHSLSEFTLGELVSGNEVDFSTLQGKVVTIEYWGTR